MRLLSMLLLLLFGVFAVKVQCIQDPELCPRKEPPVGVVSLTQGSEVILDCGGGITVDGEPLAATLKHNQRFRRAEATTGPWTTQREEENTGTAGTYYSETRQNQTAPGNDVEDQRETVTTAKTPTVTTKKQMRHDFTVSQSTQENRVGGEEGGAFGVTMETGTSMDYEDYEDYGEEEGRRVTRGIKRETRWTRNGQRVRSIKKGWALRLLSVQLADSGNYSCYRGDQLVSSVKISVGVPPETPTLSCHKKFHTSKVRCEWVSRQPIFPRPQCYLLVRTRFENFSRTPCSYSAERSRCWCALPTEEGDKNFYDARLCVTNTAGSATSRPFKYKLDYIVKPDPPAKVVVKSVKGQLHTLVVSWSYPSTWKYGFYYLKFQLRYRPLQAREFQQLLVDGYQREFDWWISDALPHTQYEVQLQAKDEFDGVWSEWTSPVYAYTWTAPEPTITSDITSLEPWPIPDEPGSGDGSTVDVIEISERPADDTSVMWVYLLWVFGLCLFIALTMFSVYALRHRVQLLSKVNKKTWTSPCSCSPFSPPPLQQPLMVPHQPGQHQFLPVQEKEEGGINLHNFDYFFSSPGD